MNKADLKQLIDVVILIDKAKRVLNGLTWDYQISGETDDKMMPAMLEMEGHLNTALNAYFLADKSTD